jgi:hypothetical protein
MPCFEVSEEQNVAVICSLMFASDTDKDKKLYVLHIDAVIDIFERVGCDEVTEMLWAKDQLTGQESLKLS